MTLREILNNYVATDNEIQKAEDAAKEAALTAPRGVHSHLSGMIMEKVIECRTFKAAAEIIEGMYTSEELHRELPVEKSNLFAPMLIAKTLLLQTFEK